MIVLEIKQCNRNIYPTWVFLNCNKSPAPTSKSMNIIQNAPE